MKTKIFQSGNGQAVRIPEELRFDSTMVETFNPDDEVVITPTPENLGKAFELFIEMPSDLLCAAYQINRDARPSRESVHRLTGY